MHCRASFHILLFNILRLRRFTLFPPKSEKILRREDIFCIAELAADFNFFFFRNHCIKLGRIHAGNCFGCPLPAAEAAIIHRFVAHHMIFYALQDLRKNLFRPVFIQDRLMEVSVSTSTPSPHAEGICSLSIR